MGPFISLPPFDIAFADLYSGSSGLIEKTCQFDASRQTSTYQGMTVQTLNTSFPGYHNQSDIVKNNPASLNLLN
ncbi:hypothetical protein, partial [Endozoicomonas sp. SESOKO1]|uniref:hypothetical protein n=1 Tax=Endozoicomonas sp. SESOKO1 TaxID=2828742 RepID=UPI002149455D